MSAARPLPADHEAGLAAELAAGLGELLAAMPADGLAACRFAFTEPLRARWDTGPSERAGAQLRELPPEARHLVVALLGIAHAPHGLRAVLRIMALEAVLRALEGGSAHRHPDRYWLQVFGDPGAARFGAARRRPPLLGEPDRRGWARARDAAVPRDQSGARAVGGRTPGCACWRTRRTPAASRRWP